MWQKLRGERGRRKKRSHPFGLIQPIRRQEGRSQGEFSVKFIQYFLIVNLNLACWCPICSGTARNTLSQPSIWLTIGLTSILCILPVVAYRFLLILLRPTINDKVITDRRLNGFDRGQREGRAGSVDTKNYDGNQVLPLAARLNLCPVLRLV